MEAKPQGQFLSPCSNKNDAFGEPSVVPRVGDQYQAQISPMMSEYNGEQLNKKATDAKAAGDFSKYFGLAVPIYWPKLKSEMKASQDGNVDANESKLNANEKVASALPGSRGKPWSAIERDSLVLALYLFGKNLVLVTRFIDSRGMGDILSYYYGEFFRSDEHKRWSESRKMKTRRSINGQKLLSGWRQQELLSRLFSLVSEESKNQIKEAASAFANGKTSLEDYAFALKETVGIASLVRAIGVGKGKKDLTGTTIEPTRNNNNNFSFSRPEVPIGKACAALTLPDIVKCLSGEVRLSKARANDLFWEAVWPRLLARGWHSEQPQSYNYASSKLPLVFLIPGVKKFSRRKLLKGNHFFDCVTDVLNKVAADPSLLEINDEAIKGSEEASGEENTSEDSACRKQRRSYLQPPPVPTSGQEIVVKFTIVDTSLRRGEGAAKIVQLRALPVDTGYAPTGPGSSEEEDYRAYRASPERPNGKLDVQFGKKTRSRKSKYLSPVVKQKPLTACFPVESALVKFENYPSQSSQSSGNESQEKGQDQPQPQPGALIDLNLPHAPQELAKKEAPIAEMPHDRDEPKAKDDASQEQAGRRQSTRTRPLTAKALEAIACGFLTTKKKRKADEGQPQKSRRVRVKTVPSSSASNDGSADTENA